MFQRKLLGRTNLKISEIILGGQGLTKLPWKDSIEFINAAVKAGINTIDTAAEYGNSQDRIGDTFLLPQFRRNIILSSRAEVYDKKSMAEKIESGLKKLKTDQIEIYSIGNLTESNIEQALGPGGAVQSLTDAKNNKKIKHLGFATTSPAIALRMLDELVFEVAFVPVNFLTTGEPFSEFMAKAREKNCGVFGLQPLGPEQTLDLLLSLKYLAQYPQVIPIFELKSLEEIKPIETLLKKKNLALTDEDKQVIATQKANHIQ
jgi:uncharacterized protein